MNTERCDSQMDNKNLYIFFCHFNGGLGDIVTIISTSFEEAINIYSQNKNNDPITQYIYDYGEFSYNECDDAAMENYEWYKKLWSLNECTLKDSDEEGSLKYRSYKFQCGVFYIIEQPITAYQMIACYTEDGDILDPFHILNSIKTQRESNKEEC